VFSLGPLLPLGALIYGGLAVGYGVRCSPLGCGSWPAVALGLVVVALVGVLATFGGDALPQSIWLRDAGAAFGWRRPGRVVPWEQLLGPIEAPRWGVVAILRRSPGRRPRVAGVVTADQARELVLQPEFPARVIAPWVWESLGLLPHSQRPGPDRAGTDLAHLPPGTGYRFPLAEARTHRRRHRVMVGFTAPALTAAVAGLGWAGTGELGVGLAIIGIALVGWNIALRHLVRAAPPPAAVWLQRDGLAFEAPSGLGAADGGLVTWDRLVLYPSAPSSTIRYYAKVVPGSTGTSSAFVRIPEPAAGWIVGGPPSSSAPDPRAGAARPRPSGRIPRRTSA
jgi:hypothetical protein